jgi:1,4-alpha-glucan branching enzyme
MRPEVHWNFELELYGKNKWTEIFNSDKELYWGSGNVYNTEIPMEALDKKAKHYLVKVHLPPLAAIVLK